MLSEKSKSLTVKDAFNSGAHFAVLSKWNKVETIALVTQMLSETLMLVPNTLTAEQIVYMAESIMIDCENWKPDDILIILRNGKQGKYGTTNKNFSYEAFNMWADAYAEERQSYIDNKHLDTKELSTTREDTKHYINANRKAEEREERKAEINMRKYVEDTLKPKTE